MYPLLQLFYLFLLNNTINYTITFAMVLLQSAAEYIPPLAVMTRINRRRRQSERGCRRTAMPSWTDVLCRADFQLLTVQFVFRSAPLVNVVRENKYFFQLATMIFRENVC